MENTFEERQKRMIRIQKELGFSNESPTDEYILIDGYPEALEIEFEKRGEQLKYFVRMDIKDGDVIITNGKLRGDQLQKFAKALDDMGKKNILIFSLGEGQTVQHLNEELMNREGWYKLSKEEIANRKEIHAMMGEK